MPGTLGTLEWACLLRQAGKEGMITLAEVDTAPYVCRKTAPDTATIWGVVTGPGLGVLPSTETARVQEMLEPLFPGLRPYPDVMTCGLAAMNPVVHPAGVLMNAGRLEYARGNSISTRKGYRRPWPRSSWRWTESADRSVKPWATICVQCTRRSIRRIRAQGRFMGHD